jgi:hypothetical protein
MDATTQAEAGSIDTRKVAGRRKVRYESIDELLADVDCLSAAEAGGTLTRLGNWTLGQAIGHIAVWAEYAYTGAPVKPPFLMRLLVRPFKGYFLTKGLPAGVRLRNVEGGTYGVDVMPTDVAVARLRTVAQRLKVDAPTIPNGALGKLTHDESIALFLRHGELHLSFFVPK